VKTEQLLKAARVPEMDKVDVVSIQLTDIAHIWWTNEMVRIGEPATWETFAEAFLDKFFPETAKIEMERRFTNLIQGNRSVDDYASEFTRLGRFAPALVADEASRARRFKMGLDFSILEHIISHRHMTYADVLTAARDQEMVQRRRKAVQRPPQAGRTPIGKPSGGPIRRPAQTPTARTQPYQSATVTKDLVVVCDHCSRTGHVRKDCRLLNGQCLSCGSKDHRIRDCPTRRPDVTTEGPVPARQQGAPARGQARPPQQQALTRGRGKPVPKDGNAGARGQAFNLTAEDAETAEGVVEGII
jgi:hypothetical protein